MQHESHNYEDIAGARTVGLHCGPTGNAAEFFFKERSVRGDQGTRGRGGGLSTASTDAVAFKGRMGNSDMQIEPDSYRCLVTGLENVAQSELKKRKGAVKKNSERSLFLSHDCDVVWCVQIVKSPFFVLFCFSRQKNKQMEGVSWGGGKKNEINKENQPPLNIKTMAETNSRGVSLLRQQTVGSRLPTFDGRRSAVAGAQQTDRQNAFCLRTDTHTHTLNSLSQGQQTSLSSPGRGREEW